jgi:hypothetical protein
MTRYCLNTDEVKFTKKALKKWDTFPVDTDRVSGTIIIKNLRKYLGRGWECDVEFKGKACFHYKKKQEFYTSELYNEKGVSKIKINRILKRGVYEDIKRRLMYFDVDLYYHESIKKIKWI